MDENRRQSGRSKRRESRGAETELRQSLSKRLAAYALAAGGAGLGIVGGAQPAEANIVYTKTNAYFEWKLPLYLTNYGQADFLIYQFTYPETDGGTFWELRVNGAPGNDVLGHKNHASSSIANASRLPKGAGVGASGLFSSKGMMGFAQRGGSLGVWGKGTSGFLGLKFQIDGQTHYGWAQISIFTTEPFRGMVMGYAYNTVPDEPIRAGQTSEESFIGEMAPQPATLGLLALGAPGVDIWRPRKREPMAE
jgi:hypothetical protein